MPSTADLRWGRSHVAAAPPLDVPRAARLWLASSLTLWGLGAWPLLG